MQLRIFKFYLSVGFLIILFFQFPVYSDNVEFKYKPTEKDLNFDYLFTNQNNVYGISSKNELYLFDSLNHWSELIDFYEFYNSNQYYLIYTNGKLIACPIKNNIKNNIIISYDFGSNWDTLDFKFPSDSLFLINIEFLNDNSLILFTSNELQNTFGPPHSVNLDIFKTFDIGKSWIKILSNPIDSTFEFIDNYSIDYENNSIFIAANTLFFSSYDNGKTWKRNNLLKENLGLDYMNSIIKLNNNFLYALNKSYSSSNNTLQIFKSTNSGKKWELIINESFDFQGYFTIYTALNNNYLFITSYGDSFLIAFNSINNDIYTINLIDYFPTNLYKYVSVTNIFSHGDTTYVCTVPDGYLEIINQPDSTLSIEYKKDVPHISLFPNPASEYISISLPEEVIGDIEIIDEMGNKIKSLNSSALSGSIYLDVKDYSTGVYFAIIRTKSEVITKKFVKY